MVRAEAPQRRTDKKKWRLLREPSVSWLPKRSWSPVACRTRTRCQSASSSSATTIGRLVRTPCPISWRWQVIVTVPSSPIATNTSGLSTHPFGIESAPYLSACAPAERRRGTPTASTSPETAIVPRNARRLILTIFMTCSLPPRPGGCLFLLQRRRPAHDPPGRKIPALRHAEVEPGRLHGVADRIGADRFD